MNSVPESLTPWLPLGELLARLQSGEVPPRTSVHHDPLTGVYRVLFYQHRLVKKLKYLWRTEVLLDPHVRFARATFDARDQLLQLELHPFIPGQTQEAWLETTLPKESPGDPQPLHCDGARPGAGSHRPGDVARRPVPGE